MRWKSPHRSHERRRKKRQLKRAETSPPGPVVRSILSSEASDLDAQRAQQVPQDEHMLPIRRLLNSPAATPPIPISEQKAKPLAKPKNEKSETNKPRASEIKMVPRLPRLLRQARGEVPPRGSHDRANGEDQRDFEKLEGFLWREYYKIVSRVRRVEKQVPRLLPARKRKRSEKASDNRTITAVRKRSEKASDNRTITAVRKIPVIPDPGLGSGRTPVEQCFANMKLTGRHLAMLTEQLHAITGLEGSQLQAWTASKQRNGSGHPSRRHKRSLVRTVRLTSPSPDKASPRRSRTSTPRRNPSDLEPPPQPDTPDSSPDIVPFRPLLTHSLLPLLHNRPALLRTQILPSLHSQASRMIKRAQILSAQTRALLPSAPVQISPHSSRVAAPSQQSRRSTRAPRARRSVGGGWKGISKRVVDFADGEDDVAVEEMVDKARRRKLAGDVEQWLTGDVFK
ncbi:hypothetical protein N0V86_008949 [Didymella sp. IMI 355093]|nr:hypothetical protein N0V86_008949 [Didymella sp. IMI 355093]